MVVNPKIRFWPNENPLRLLFLDKNVKDHQQFFFLFGSFFLCPDSTLLTFSPRLFLKGKKVNIGRLGPFFFIEAQNGGPK